MILVVARATIRPGMHQKLRDIAHALQHEHAPREDGCLKYDTFIDGDTFVILDQWRDQAALDAHMQAPMWRTTRRRSRTTWWTGASTCRSSRPMK